MSSVKGNGGANGRSQSANGANSPNPKRPAIRQPLRTSLNPPRPVNTTAAPPSLGPPVIPIAGSEDPLTESHPLAGRTEPTHPFSLSALPEGPLSLSHLCCQAASVLLNPNRKPFPPIPTDHTRLGSQAIGLEPRKVPLLPTDLPTAEGSNLGGPHPYMSVPPLTSLQVSSDLPDLAAGAAMLPLPESDPSAIDRSVIGSFGSACL